MAVILEDLPATLDATAVQPAVITTNKRRKRKGADDMPANENADLDITFPTTTAAAEPPKARNRRTRPVISHAELAQAEEAAAATNGNGKHVIITVPTTLELKLGIATIEERPATPDEERQIAAGEPFQGAPTISPSALETIGDGMTGELLPFEPSEAEIAEMQAALPDELIEIKELEPIEEVDEQAILLAEGLEILRRHGTIELREDGSYLYELYEADSPRTHTQQEVIDLAVKVRQFRADKELSAPIVPEPIEPEPTFPVYTPDQLAHALDVLGSHASIRQIDNHYGMLLNGDEVRDEGGYRADQLIEIAAQTSAHYAVGDTDPISRALYTLGYALHHKLSDEIIAQLDAVRASEAEQEPEQPSDQQVFVSEAVSALRALFYTVKRHGIHWLVTEPDSNVVSLTTAEEIIALRPVAELRAAKSLLSTHGELEGESAPYSYFLNAASDETITFSSDEDLMTFYWTLLDAKDKEIREPMIEAAQEAAEPPAEADPLTDALALLAQHGTIEEIEVGERWRFTPTGQHESIEWGRDDILASAAQLAEGDDDDTGEGELEQENMLQARRPKVKATALTFEVLRENLVAGVQAVRNAVAGKSQLPVLKNILFEGTSEGRLILSGTNLAEGITARMGAKVKIAGAITVQADLLDNVLGAMSGDLIIGTVDVRTQTLHLVCPKADKRIQQARFKGIEADEFPIIPGIADDAEVWTIPNGGMLLRIIDHVLTGVATDDTRPILAGMLLRFSKKKLEVASADGFRLHRMEVDLTSGGRNIDMIVPGHGMAVLARLLDEKEPVEVMYSEGEGHVIFRQGGVDMASRLIEGTFPDIDRIIPTWFAARAIVDRKELLSAVKLAGYYAATSSKICRLIVGKQDLEITGNAAEVGDGSSALGGAFFFAEQDMQGKAITAPEQITVALNNAFFAQMLACLTTDKIAIEVQTGMNAPVFKEVGEEGFLGLVMPMTVR